MPEPKKQKDVPVDWIMGLAWIVWRRRALFLYVWTFIVALGIAYAFIAQPVYKATVVLAPAKAQAPGGALAALVGQVGGLSSLMGLAGLGDSDQYGTIAHLRARALAERFFADEHVLPTLFAKYWDSDQGAWRRDLKPRSVPTLDDAWELWDRRVRGVSQDQKTGLITLTIRWKDPAIAAQWANKFAERANTEIRLRTLRDADASLRALQRELDQTSAVELRQVIYGLMEAQIQRKVLANSRVEFAFSIIDPATVSDVDRFDTPKRPLLIVLAALVGLVVSLISVAVAQSHSSLSRSRASATVVS